MSLFATLNPEQLGRVQRARNAVSPFDLGACLTQAFEALKRDFWSIVLVNFVWLLLSCFLITIPPLMVGICRFNDKALRGEVARMDDLFSGFNDFGASWLMMLVMVPFLIVAFILCYLPGIYLYVAWMLGWNLLADKRGSFWECLEMSRQAVTAHWGWALLLVIVAQLLSQAGIVACFVGILATLPLYTLMISAAYGRLFAEPLATA
jgi:uncharacterized membrane protein